MSFLMIFLFLAGIQNAEIPNSPLEQLTEISEIDSPQQIFNRANYLMDQGQYSQALSMYKTIEQSGNISGPLFANMAFIYIRKDSLGLAKYYLLKAEDFPQTRTRASQTLEYVNSALQSRSGQLPVLPLYAFSDWLRHDLGSSRIFLFTIISFNVAVFLIIMYWIIGKYRRTIVFSSAILASLATLLLITGIYIAETNDHQSKAVVVSKELTIYQNPDTTAEPVGLAYEGFTITLDHKQKAPYPGWIYINMSNGLSGWTQQHNLRSL